MKEEKTSEGERGREERGGERGERRREEERGEEEREGERRTSLQVKRKRGMKT